MTINGERKIVQEYLDFMVSSSSPPNNSGSYINIAFIVVTGTFIVLFCILGYVSYIKKINRLMDKKFETIEEKKDISDLGSKRGSDRFYC